MCQRMSRGLSVCVPILLLSLQPFTMSHILISDTLCRNAQLRCRGEKMTGGSSCVCTMRYLWSLFGVSLLYKCIYALYCKTSYNSCNKKLKLWKNQSKTFVSCEEISTFRNGSIRYYWNLRNQIERRKLMVAS